MTTSPNTVVAVTAFTVIVTILLGTIVYTEVHGLTEEAQLTSSVSSAGSEHDVVAWRGVRNEVAHFINANIVPENIRNSLRNLTQAPHMAGTPGDEATALWVKDVWTRQGLDVHTVSYDVLLSRPHPDSPNKVRILLDDGGTVLFEAEHHQKPLYAPEEDDERVTDNFNAYSPAGVVTSDGLIYVNFGRSSDFDELEGLGVNVSGSIILARYGRNFRGDKVEEAASRGAVGVVLFSDPNDYAPTGYGVYPDTVMMPPSGAQLGSVRVPNGDPLTPFYPSIDSAYRLPEEEAQLPLIPVQPISYEDAYQILLYLEGPEAPSTWQGGLNLTYHLGPSLGLNRKMQLAVYNTNYRTNVQNVVATITGTEEPDRYVLVGNHRDAWIFGSIDPSSGTAAMLEMTRVLMALHNETGWQPRRSLVFCSWAAEEYGLIGSMEWAEQFTKQLGDRAVAYLNVDQAINGNYTFRAKSTPLFYELLWNVTKQVPNPDPAEVTAGRTTVYDTWLERLADLNHPGRPWISSIASGSDFSPMQQVLGIPSLDLRYTLDNEVTSGEPLYHTLYETFALVDELYDKDYMFHSAITSIWSMLSVALADTEVLPYSPDHYPDYLQLGLQDIQDIHGDMIAARNISLELLSQAVDSLSTDITTFMAGLNDLDLTNSLAVRRSNDQLMMIERAFLDPRGLPHRPQYLHVITSPSEFDVYTSSAFPALHDLLQRIASAGTGEEQVALWRDFSQHLAAVTHFVTTAGRVLTDRLW